MFFKGENTWLDLKQWIIYHCYTLSYCPVKLLSVKKAIEVTELTRSCFETMCIVDAMQIYTLTLMNQVEDSFLLEMPNKDESDQMNESNLIRTNKAGYQQAAAR